MQDREAGSQAVKGIAENESNSKATSRGVAGSFFAFARELQSVPGIGGSGDATCPNGGPDRLERGKIQEEQTRLRQRFNFASACSAPRPRFANSRRKTTGCRNEARNLLICPARRPC